MAKKKTEDAEVAGGTTLGDVAPVSGETYRAAIAEVNQRKAEAAEAAGLAGTAKKALCDRHGIDKKAFGFVSSLSRMEEATANSVLRDVLIGARFIGLFRQASLLDDDVLAVMREIVNGADDGIEELPVDPAAFADRALEARPH